MTILEKINEIMKEVEVLDDVELTMDTTFEELDLDSLSLVDLSMSCEDEFDVQLDLANPPKTVGELVEMIKAQIGDKE